VSQGSDFEALCRERAARIVVLLREPNLKHWLRFWEPRPRDPELRKLLSRIHTAIWDAQRLDAEGTTTFDDTARARAIGLLEIDPRRLGLDSALETVEAWDQLLIERGDERYVRDLLVVEFARDRIDTSATTWSDVFGEVPEPLAERIRDGGALDASVLDAARNQLAGLYRARSTLYELSRARLAMKGHHLVVLAPVLLVLIAAFVGTIGLVGGKWDSIALAAVAGAVGATLSGTRKLRDHVRTIHALRAFSAAVVVQPLVGATAGLFVLLVLESGLLEIDWGGPEWAVQGTVAFAAGFSEPFFLGVIGRVAEIGEPATSQEAHE
jgi:hypothetical protein